MAVLAEDTGFAGILRFIRATDTSDLTLYAYARHHGLDGGLLYWWRSKLGAGPHRRKASAAPAAPTPLTFVLPGGRRVWVRLYNFIRLPSIFALRLVQKGWPVAVDVRLKCCEVGLRLHEALHAAAQREPSGLAVAFEMSS